MCVIGSGSFGTVYKCINRLGEESGFEVFITGRGENVEKLLACGVIARTTSANWYIQCSGGEISLKGTLLSSGPSTAIFIKINLRGCKKSEGASLPDPPSDPCLGRCFPP